MFMEINVMGFNILPALFFIFLFILLGRVLIIPAPYKKGKFPISMALSGFFGFFLSLPIIFYPPFFHVYFFVPVLCFIVAVIGGVLCIVLNVNPFFPNEKVYQSKKKNQEMDSSNMNKVSNENESTHLAQEKSTPVFQSEKESLASIWNELGKLPFPSRTFHDLSLKNSGEKLPFHFIVVGTTGIFHIYPCNWSGNVKFSNSGGLKTLESELDSKDYIMSTPYRNKMIQNIIRSTGYNNESIQPIICTTNPTISYTTNANTYAVVDVKDIFSYITNNTSLQPINRSDLQEIAARIDENSEKHKK